MTAELDPSTTDTQDRTTIIRTSDRENLWFVGDLIQLIVKSEMTEGRFSMSMTHAKPASEPPLHEHQNEDEIFFVLEGQVQFWAGTKYSVLGPGDCIVAPKDVPHIFQASVNVESKWLTLSVPGGLDHFFRDAGEKAEYLGPRRNWEVDQDTIDRLHAASAKHDITIMDPQTAEEIKKNTQISE